MLRETQQTTHREHVVTRKSKSAIMNAQNATKSVSKHTTRHRTQGLQKNRSLSTLLLAFATQKRMNKQHIETHKQPATKWEQEAAKRRRQ